MNSGYQVGSSTETGSSSMYTATGGGNMQMYQDKVKQMIQRYQNNPEELKSLASNRVVLAIGAALGLALLTGQIRRKR